MPAVRRSSRADTSDREQERAGATQSIPRGRFASWASPFDTLIEPADDFLDLPDVIRDLADVNGGLVHVTRSGRSLFAFRHAAI